MEYKEFCEGLDLNPDDLYVKRLFELVNVSLTGFVTFKEFLTTVWDYLVVDRDR